MLEKQLKSVFTNCKYSGKMKFIWDEKKRQGNIEKHGIDFADVHEVFNHPMFAFHDNRVSYGEERWIGVGLMKIIIVVVVFTELDADTIRIISARKATKYECKEYQKKIKN